MRSLIAVVAVLALLFGIVFCTHVNVNVDVAPACHHPDHHHTEHHTEHPDAEVDMAQDADNGVKEADVAPAFPIVEAAETPRAPINHGTNGIHYGVDVSRYQTITDHAKVVANLRRMGGGSDPFCFVKMTEGNGYIWSDGARHVKAFQDAGCLTGTYHFFHSSAGVQAQLKRILNNRHGARYVMLDAELPESGAAKNARALLGELQKNGIKPILYTSNALGNQWRASTWGVPLWIARYSTSKPTVKKVDLWQYSESGRVAGIAGKVDLDKTLCSKERFEEIFY